MYLFLKLYDLMFVEDLDWSIYIFDLLGRLSYVLERLCKGLLILSTAGKRAT